MRGGAATTLAGDLESACMAIQSPLFGIPLLGGSPARDAILRWALKAGHMDDLVLAVVGTAISLCASNDASEHGPTPLTRVLGECANAARETAMGQFITQVQGAKAMLRVRKGGKAAWKQGKQMDAVAGLLGGQVRSALGDDPEIPIKGKEVVSVLTPKGETRRIDLRRPSKDDWRLLEVARHPRGGKDPHKDTWMTFAMMVLCAAQAEAGWFDLVECRSTRERKGYRDGKSARRRKRPHGLVLASDAQRAIQKDLDKWVRMGFIHSPMIVPPQEGDYLSVKHRIIAGRRGPMGLRTDARDSAAWAAACDVFAGTAWTVPAPTLKAIRESEFIRSLAARSEPDETRRELILGEYARVAGEEAFYLPLFMDFRGRIYSRSSLVTCQGRDLQKSLMTFPAREHGEDYGAAWDDAVVLHMAALYGGPDKLDKAPYRIRHAWAQGVLPRVSKALFNGDWEAPPLMEILEGADEPLQLLTAMLGAVGAFPYDRLACQIDGTCNGLQHLTALFRDETAAPFVNLTERSLDDRPYDIYSEVALRVSQRLLLENAPWARRVRAAVRIDRKLCKKPVMVLPYGGTRVTIEDAVHQAILDQGPWPDFWTDGRVVLHSASNECWSDWGQGNYQAFFDRDLKDHPLLRLDAQRLGGIVWDCIVEVLPRPMAAMEAFRAIAKGVGERTLEWSTGFQYGDKQPLWVVQAKDKSQKTGLKMKGFELPGSVRGLMMRKDTDEIDPRAHVSGIVANFIHSQDAAHLARTMHFFKLEGGTSFGAIHDCLLGRPSEMGLMANSVRSSFFHQYCPGHNPLDNPVRLRDPKGEGVEEFPSWFILAESMGVTFPEFGEWEPAEVMDSAWFFS
jgi:hypothetical protein